MAIEVYIPKFGQTVEEVTIVEWLVEEGAMVEKGDEVLRVETDKAIFSVEAPGNGNLHRGPYQSGDVLPVLSIVAVIGDKDDQFPIPQSDSRLREERFDKNEAEVPIEVRDTIPELNDGQQRIFISPRARRLARQKHVSLDSVIPTGGGGIRIVERDILAALKRSAKLTPLARKIAESEGIEVDEIGGGKKWITKEDVTRMREKLSDDAISTQKESDHCDYDIIPIQGIRKVIFEHMAASVHTTARVTLTTELDAVELVLLKARLQDRVSEKWGFSPTYLDLIGKIVIAALKKYPYMNTRLEQDNLEVYRTVNLGIAVDTERGLIVPVVHNAEKLSLRQFGQKVRELAAAARAGNISPDLLRGGTFTISNLGAFEIDAFTPVINTPEIAILGIGRIVERVVPYHNQIVIHPTMTLSLVFDHRVVDGAPAARFLQEVKHSLEDPTIWLIENLGEDNL